MNLTDSSIYIPSITVLALLFIGLMIPHAHAQTETLSPLIEDQDGDGNPLNEESRIGWGCYMNETFFKSLSATLGSEHKPTISVDDCNFVMHYLSGQCEELMAKGANVTILDQGVRMTVKTLMDLVGLRS